MRSHRHQKTWMVIMSNVKNKTEFQHHLKLIVDGKIDRSDVHEFVRTIKDKGPSHILKPVEVYDDVGESSMKFYIIRKDEESTIVMVPLMRDLTEGETEKIIKAWNRKFDNDYVIESSMPYTGKVHQTPEDIGETPDPYMNTDLREFHFKWTTTLVESGWRYGTRYDQGDKTHPMLLPWEQLPRNYKETYSSILAGILDRTEK